MPSQQTNNSRLYEKVQLRRSTLPAKKQLNILDCFAGEGVIWDAVIQGTDKQINVVSIEKKQYEKGVASLRFDNRKVLRSIDLNRFDVIDLDHYGIPIEQLEILFEKGYKGTVYVTSIVTGMRQIPYKLVEANGLPREMYRQCGTIFGKFYEELLYGYLRKKGVTEIDLIRCNDAGSLKLYFKLELQ